MGGHSVNPPVVIDPRYYDAVIFDLYGALKDAASLQRQSWTSLFNDHLARRPAYRGENHSPLTDDDYDRLLHAKPGPDGVADFLASRGITLPRGSASDIGDNTVCGLVNRQRRLYAELLGQIARFWVSRATFDAERGRYSIRGVIGPDEFHSGYLDAPYDGIDNNAYTNVMAVWVIMRALDALELLPLPNLLDLREKLRLRDDELAHWNDVSRRMFVPFHDGVISQFEGYGELQPHWPETLGELAIPIHYRGLHLHLRVSGRGVIISVDPRGAGEIDVECRGQVKRLTPGGAVRFAG